jgi:thiol:disulfide interchange protein DsbD
LSTAVFAWPHADDGEGFFTVRARQLYAIVGAIVGAYLLLGTLLTQGFILPPMQLGGAGAAAQGPKIPWLRDEASAVRAAEASGKLMVIDFSAEWCQACHELEKYTYTDPAVIAEAENFVPAMLDCTRSDDPAIKAVQQKYGVTGLPTVVFARADGTIVNVVVGFLPAPEFLAEMKKARGA